MAFSSPIVNLLEEEKMTYDEWAKDNKGWVKFVKEGGKLANVPEIHRRDEVSFWATRMFKVSGDANLIKNWALDVLPFVPHDVLFYNYLLNGLPWANKADEEANKRPLTVCFLFFILFFMHYNNMFILNRILI